MDHSRRRTASYLVGVCLAAGIAGCQSTGGAGASSAESPGTPTTWAPPPPPDGETTLINTGEYGFHSPSGNISCHVLDKPGGAAVGARCDIIVHSYPPPSGVGCPHYTSMSIGVDGPGEFTCTPASGAGTADVLAYWDSVQVGRFTCKSKDSGVDCENTQTQHGFELGAAAFRRY